MAEQGAAPATPEENPTIKKLVKRIAELEEQLSKETSEKGATLAELNSLKKQLSDAEDMFL